LALAELRAEVEARVREQIERHLRVNPHANIARAIDIQMQEERDRLERLVDEADGEQAEALLALMAWLPQFERELKRRNR
jgi:regulator of protease activity HflC (stomatin/prohibitin superfamily)